MSRPSHLASGRSRQSDLIPRTPLSRSGRTDSFSEEVELNDRSTRFQQTEPLLVSSASSGFPSSDHPNATTSTKKSNEGHIAFLRAQIPIIFGVAGVGLACMLLFLIVVSYQLPGSVQRIMGVAPASDPDDKRPNTIVYTPYYKFPLKGTEYEHECNKLMHTLHGLLHHGAYWDQMKVDVPHRNRSRTCNSTITYQLDGDVGLMGDLALAAQVASLARQQGRTFFIEDSHWNRGKWKDHFLDVRLTQPGPEPDCIFPPAQELVACPRTARHWIVNSHTAKFHLGHKFANEFEDAYARELNRLKPIFRSAEESFSHTIRPNPKTAGLIATARAEIQKHYGKQFPAYVGAHIRRGDRNAMSWQFRDAYVPLENYAESIKTTIARLYPSSRTPSSVYIASDSPRAHDDLVALLPKGTRIFSLAKSKKSGLRTLASPAEYHQDKFNELPNGDRVKLTRGMIVDFAMLSGAWRGYEETVVPYGTVCTITSSVCRMSAVAMGWASAFGTVDETGEISKDRHGWVEIDNGGNVSPVWQAFEVFP